MKTTNLQFNSEPSAEPSGGAAGARGLPSCGTVLAIRAGSLERARVAGLRVAGAIRGCVSRLRRRGSESELKARVAELAVHDAPLRAHREEVERAFLEAAGQLGRQRELAAELVRHGRRFDSFASSDTGENAVRAAIALVEQSLREFDAFHDESSGLMEQLRAQQEEIARLQHNGAQLERAISPLRIVHTLLRIEAATLPAELQAAFGALTQEIGGLDSRVRNAFVRHFDALDGTRDRISGIVQHLQMEREEFDRVAAEERLAMRRSLAVLETEIAAIRKRNERSSSLVAEIERETSGVIVGLQYQDITRQKLEHVQAAVETLSARVAERPEDAAIAFVGQSSRLQALQLQAIDHDLRSAVDAIDKGLRKVVGRLERIESESLGESDCAATAGNVATISDALAAMLTKLKRSMERVESNARKAAEAVRSFGEVTADLGDTIRELTWGIRLIALNAQVQAAQVARCDGLEVLARHTYVVSEQTSQFGEVVGRDLGGIHERLQEIVHQAARFASEAADARQRLEAEADRVGSRLSEQRQNVIEAAREFPALLRRTSRHASELLDRTGLANVDRTPLHALRADLEALVGWCATRSTTAAEAEIREELSSLQRQYTMESERAVHAAALSGDALDGRGAGSGMAAVGKDPAESGGGTDFGDNVELF